MVMESAIIQDVFVLKISLVKIVNGRNKTLKGTVKKLEKILKSWSKRWILMTFNKFKSI